MPWAVSQWDLANMPGSACGVLPTGGRGVGAAIHLGATSSDLPLCPECKFQRASFVEALPSSSILFRYPLPQALTSPFFPIQL